jgi:hypothetical protein
MVDFNESLDNDQSPLLRMVTQLGLSDVWNFKYPHLEPFSTYAHSSRRLDYMFMSDALLPSINSVTYFPFDTLPTVHRPIVVDCITDTLFGNRTSQLTHQSSREFNSSDIPRVKEYLTRMHSVVLCLELDTTMTRLLNQSTVTSTEIEDFNNLLGIAMEEAAQPLCKRRPQWFSTTLARARNLKSIYKQMTQNLHLQRPLDAILHRLTILEVTATTPTNLEEA